EAESALLRELATSAPAGEACSALRVVSGHGRPDAHLVTRADEGQFDAVVVGLRPHSLVEQVWRGSVARGVLQSAPVTVASVPAPVGEVETSFRPPQIVVVGMDFDESSHRALAHAIGHAVEGATVHVAHVLGPYALTSERGQAREDAWYRLSKLDRGIALERSISIETHILDGVPA